MGQPGPDDDRPLHPRHRLVPAKPKAAQRMTKHPKRRCRECSCQGGQGRPLVQPAPISKRRPRFLDWPAGRGTEVSVVIGQDCKVTLGHRPFGEGPVKPGRRACCAVQHQSRPWPSLWPEDPSAQHRTPELRMSMSSTSGPMPWRVASSMRDSIHWTDWSNIMPRPIGLGFSL